MRFRLIGNSARRLGRAVLAGVLCLSLCGVPAYADDAGDAAAADGAAPVDEVDVLTVVEEVETDEAVVLSEAEQAEQDALALAEAQAASEASLLASDATLTCNNGWVLYYAIEDGGVEITGVATEGTGSLQIPERVGLYNVVSIASGAFQGCDALTDVELPSTVSYIGFYAFMNSSLESINIPAAVSRITYRCFRGCESLTDIEFEGDTLRYLGDGAFYGCSSLEKIELPRLTSTPALSDATEDGVSFSSSYYSSSSAIGAACFQYCTSLSTFVFGGPVTDDLPKYFYNSSCLAYCPSEITFVCKGGTVAIPSSGSGGYSPTSYTVYSTVDFYASAEDAESLENSLGSVTLLTRAQATSDSGSSSTYVVQAFPLIYGTTDYSEYYYEDAEIPACPDGKTWGVVTSSSLSVSSSGSGNSSSSSDGYFASHSRLTGSAVVVAVDPENLDYGWVSSPSVAEYYTENSSGTPTFYLNANGTVSGLSGFAAYSSDGTELDESAYELVFEQGETTGSGNAATTTWTEISLDEISEAGSYRVYAVGTGDYADTSTRYLQFTVAEREVSVTSYYDADSLAAYLADVSYAAAVQVSDTAFNVVVPASEWENQLLGAGFAGSGNGVLLYDNGEDFSTTAVQATNLTSGNYMVIGSTEQVPESVSSTEWHYLVDYLKERDGALRTRYGADATSARELAYSAIYTYNPSNWGGSWGTTAVIASSTDALMSSSAAQYAYQTAARVFFVQENGTMAADDLEEIVNPRRGYEIDTIVLVGDETYVSDDVASAIESATGIEPTRILDSSRNVASATIGLAEQLVASGESSWDSVVIADSSTLANVSAASLLAEALGGVMLSCSNEIEARLVEAYLESMIVNQGLEMVSDIRTVGEFAYLSGDAGDYFATGWSAAYEDLNATGAIELSVGDTIDAGYTYVVGEGQTVELLNTDANEYLDYVPDTLEFGGVSYAVTYDETLWTGGFTDATLEDWVVREDWISYVSSHGLMTGYYDEETGLRDTFGVNNTITRAEVVVVLYRAMTNAADDEAYVTNTTPFTDVAESYFYSAALNWAWDEGIVTGDKDSETGDLLYTMRPDDPITREEIAVMIARVCGSEEGNDLSSASSMPDWGDVQEWAQEGVAFCYNCGIMTGNLATGTLNPLLNATRAEFAKIITVTVRDVL